jgi:catechol 2,3-dioxygenase-like lactoylglutathione lyase family enzyme
MEILFIAGFGPISREPAASRRFYADALGIVFEADGDYLHTGDLDGSRHFAVWPLEQAAESCYGTAGWPADVPVPQAWVEFDVTDVAAAAAELEAGGYRLVHGPKTMPWGQTLARVLTPEGLLVGIAHTPWMRDPAPAAD